MSQMPDTCEVCPTTLAELKSETPAKSLSIFMTIWMCPSCLNKEKELQGKSKAEADARVQTSRLLVESRRIDESIQVREDVFNAHTIAIIDLKTAIDSDTTIQNKPLALAEELHRRFQHLSKVIFDTRVILSDAGNQQRAIQTYMNTLSNQLRSEEREKLKLQDINYKPDVVKNPKIKSSGKPKKQPTMKECKEMAAAFGIDVEFIRARQIRQPNETVEESAREIAKKLGVFPKTVN